MITGIPTVNNSNKSGSCGATAGHHYYGGAASPTTLKTPNQYSFGQYRNEEQRQMYDTYLCKLDPKSQFSKTLAQQLHRGNSIETGTPQQQQPAAVVANGAVKPPTTDEERLRIKERYAEKEKERRIKMYEQALLMAIEREREEGRRSRSQREIKFHINYGTYFGQKVYVVGSSNALGSWSPSKALPLSWGPGNVWSGTTELSTDDGVVEYKYILKDINTGSVQWEAGFNHKINTKEINSQAIVIEDQWGSGAL